VLVTAGPGPALLARDASHAASWTLPVVAVAVDDPVQMGLATSITRPGGYITGLSGAFRGILPKRLQLMKDILPGARRMAILFNPLTATREVIANDMPQWQRTIDLSLDLVPARGPQDFDAAFEAMVSARAEAVAILADATFYAQRLRLGELCLLHRLPAVVGGRDYLGAGFVVSYQGDFAAMFRRAAGLVDKILKGTKPGEIPFEQSSKLDLVVNLRAARALGLRIPASVLVSADEIIE
jgi:putative tryptophan/tyrosine transport system substrate-binding protein